MQPVITDLGVIDLVGGALRLVELAPCVTLEEVRERTGPELHPGRQLASRG